MGIAVRLGAGTQSGGAGCYRPRSGRSLRREKSCRGLVTVLLTLYCTVLVLQSRRKGGGRRDPHYRPARLSIVLICVGIGGGKIPLQREAPTAANIQHTLCSVRKPFKKPLGRSQKAGVCRSGTRRSHYQSIRGLWETWSYPCLLRYHSSFFVSSIFLLESCQLSACGAGTARSYSTLRVCAVYTGPPRLPHCL